ncbi:MAG: hypothetical protein QW745_05295 [Thermoplasmata archaeon]
MNEIGIHSTSYFQIWHLPTVFLRKYKDNLMVLLRGNDIQTRKELLDFLNDFIEKNKMKLRNLQAEEMLEGFHASPEGLSELVFITNNIGDRTAKNTIMTLENETNKDISVKVAAISTTFSLSKNLIKPAIKTLTGILGFDVTKQHDYIITGNFDEFNKVLSLSRWKGKFDWELVKKRLKDRESFIAIQHRIRMNSPNTHIIAVYSDVPFYTTHDFNIFKVDKDEAKVFALYFNSILGFLQLSNYSSETTGGYMLFMKSDLVNVKVPDIKKLNEKELKSILDLFDKLRDVKFPSIVNQLETNFKERVELDTLFLRLFGFSEKEIRDWLPKLYRTLLEDMSEN